MEKLKREFLELLKTDEEFRYAVMGLLGLGEVVKRIEEHTKAIRALQRQSERQWRSVRQLLKELAESRKTAEEHSKAIQSLQVAMEEHTKAIRALQKTVDRHSKAIQSLQKAVEEHSKAIQSLQKTVEVHSSAIQSLQRAVEDHSKAIRELSARVNALGTRWGVVSEEAFRESVKYRVKDLLREYRAERWVYRDDEGYVFGRPAVVEADLLVRDGVHILVEFKASADRGDVYELYRIGQLYERTTGVKPRLLLVSPAVRRRAADLAEELGVEVRGEVAD